MSVGQLSETNVNITTREQVLELVRAAEATIQTEISQCQWQILGNADQLQDELSSGKLDEQGRRLLIENLVKRPVRRHLGLLKSTSRMVHEIILKLEHLPLES